MTLLGKIFVGLITLLSLVFLGLAIAVTATHRNWRDVVLDPVKGLKVVAEAKERTNQQLQQSLQKNKEELAQEQAARRTALAALESRVAIYEEQLSNSQKKQEALQSQVTENISIDKSRADELERLSKDNTNLRAQILAERQERDVLFVRASKVTDQLSLYRGLSDNLEERNKQLLTMLTRYQEVIDKLGVNPNDPLDGAPPVVNGQVLVVNRPANLVEVSIGWDEGLREGHLLEVTRGGRYLGKIRVKKADPTRPDRAVAEILNDFRQGVIVEGDRVDTTLD